MKILVWKVLDLIKRRTTGETMQGISVETILISDLGEVITEYEMEMFYHLVKKEYDKCEVILSNFCFELLDLSDVEQVFIARTFFISIITDIIRVHTRKNQLHPRILSHAYKGISIIEKWGNITEFILAIPDFMKRLTTQIIDEPILIEGNLHVEKALQLINQHIKDKCLTVNWLALQLSISTTHLANVFKCQVGETIKVYIANRKMDEIVFAITHTNSSLHEIREEFGFTSHNYFIQYFKKHKGITPLQFRQQLLSK